MIHWKLSGINGQQSLTLVRSGLTRGARVSADAKMTKTWRRRMTIVTGKTKEAWMGNCYGLLRVTVLWRGGKMAAALAAVEISTCLLEECVLGAISCQCC